MKNTFLLLLFISTISSIWGQQAIPFPSSNASWAVDKTSYTFGGGVVGGMVTSRFFYRTNGDSVINGKTYTIISEAKTDYYSPCRGLIRQDSNIVYALTQHDTTETILYNFNWALGDSVIVYSLSQPVEGLVTLVDTILIGNINRKHIHISSNWMPIDMIEGLGSLQGLLYNEIPPVDFSSQLACFSQNDTIYSFTGDNQSLQGSCWDELDSLTNAMHNRPPSMLLPNTTWSDNVRFYNPNGDDLIYSNYYRTNGDTLINGIHYTIIDAYNAPRHAFLREDSTHIYCKYPSNSLFDTSEFVLYDFGDYFDFSLIPLGNGQFSGVVEYTDSILIGNVYRKHTVLNSFTQLDFVEGVGALQGLFYNELLSDHGGTLTCFSQNNFIHTTNGSNQSTFGNCWQTIGVEYSKPSSVAVFPNPTNGLMVIQDDNFSLAEVYNLNGQLLLSSSSKQLDLSSFADGMYFLTLYQSQGNRSSVKIIKNSN